MQYICSKQVIAAPFCCFRCFARTHARTHTTRAVEFTAYTASNERTYVTVAAAAVGGFSVVGGGGDDGVALAGSQLLQHAPGMHYYCALASVAVPHPAAPAVNGRLSMALNLFAHLCQFRGHSE